MESQWQWKEKFLAGTPTSEVFELEGYNPLAVIKYVNGGSEKDVERYKKECDILKTLSHPHIVVLLGTREMPNSMRFGIIMEYCSKGSLKPAIVDPKLTYTMKTVLVWAEQVFDALDYMYWKHNVVHRDIKPENIFITLEYFLKIGDFGWTTIAEQSRSGTYGAGTERYRSPSQEDEWEHGDEISQVSHRNDIYALGLVLWELCERKVVLEEYNGRHGFMRERFITDVLRKKFVAIKPIAGPLAEIVEKCTNFDRMLRPDTSTILQDLREINQQCPSLSNLNFLPTYDLNQSKLVKPNFTDSSLSDDENVNGLSV